MASAMGNATGPGRVGAPQPSREETLGRRALTGSLLALLILWTLVGNLAVCAAVFRYRHLRAKVTNIFVVSLALSDLLVALLVMPWKAAAEVAGFWPFGGFCETWLSCDIMCSTASILNLCAISLDRYWAISSPFLYERTMDRKVASVMIGAIWAVSVVISFLPVHLGWHRAEEVEAAAEEEDAADGVCDSSLSRSYAISSSLISFYIPVAVMIVTYTRIYRIARTQIRMISSLERAAERARTLQRASSRTRSVRLPPGSPRGFDHSELKVSIRKETKVLKTLSIIMGVFVCCWSPFFVLNCALPFCASGAHGRALCVGEKTFDVFVWIGWSNSSLNPIIYAFNADFRDAFLRLARWRRWGRGRGCCGWGWGWGWGCCGRCEGTETAAGVREATMDGSAEARPGGSGAGKTRGSEDSGNTTVTVCARRSSGQGTEPDGSLGTDARTRIPI